MDPGYRAERIIDQINVRAQDGLTQAEMGAIQNDTVIPRAGDIVSDARRRQAGRRRTADLIAARIADWDGERAASTASAALPTWPGSTASCAGSSTTTWLGLARDYVGSPASWVASTNLLQDPAPIWWDDVSTPASARPRPRSSRRAMDQAGAELRAALGDPDRWTWGRLHTATFREATIGTASGIGPLEWYFNAGPVAVAGRGRRRRQHLLPVQPGVPGPGRPGLRPLGIDTLFRVTNLPSYRLTIDMTDLDGARIVITTGQAGNPFDAHYSDQIEPWRTGETLPLPFTRDAIAKATRRDADAEPMSPAAADVVVVGAGTMGAWTALRSTARAGRRRSSMRSGQAIRARRPGTRPGSCAPPTARTRSTRAGREKRERRGWRSRRRSGNGSSSKPGCSGSPAARMASRRTPSPR